MSCVVLGAFFCVLRFGAALVTAILRAKHKPNNQRYNSEDDDEEEPDGTFDDHFLDLLGHAFKFYGVDYVKDAD